MVDKREKRLIGKLELREFKLSALLDVTRAINSKASWLLFFLPEDEGYELDQGYLEERFHLARWR